MPYILVFIGGGLGALCRYALSKIIDNNSFPWATLTANIISCFILGLVLGYVAQKPVDEKLQWLIISGFCGGFSTFSTFTSESFKLLVNNQSFLALTYILVSILICLLSLWIGLKVVSQP